MTRHIYLIAAGLVLLSSIQVRITTAGPPTEFENHILNHNDVHYMGTKIHTFVTTGTHCDSVLMPDFRSLINNDHQVTHDPSENLNNLGAPRNGYGVSLTSTGLRIETGGFIYEKLAPGFSSSLSLTGRIIRIQYTSPITQSVKFTLLQKTFSADTSSYLSLKAFHTFKDSLQNVREYALFRLKSFPNADPSLAYALRIDGPVTVHHMDYMYLGKFIPRIIDDCQTWKDPFKANKWCIFGPSMAYRIPMNGELNLNFGGGGGDLVDMMSYPFDTEGNYAFNITYSAMGNGKRQMQVLREVWVGNIMTSHSLSGYLNFERGDKLSVLVRMNNISNVHALILHGPLTIHRIDIVSLRLHGVVKSKHEQSRDDFNICIFDHLDLTFLD